MEARLKNTDDISVIKINGTLDIEKTQDFKSVALTRLRGQKVIFNMEGATFVGSTGLVAFLDTVRELASASRHGVKLVSLNAEFKRIFQNMSLSGLEIFESESTAIQAFKEIVPQLPTGIAPVASR